MEMKTTTKDSCGTIFSFLAASVPVILGIFIFLIPIPHTTTIKGICYYLSVSLVVVLFSFRKIHFSFRTPLALSGIIFVAWCFFGLFSAVNTANSAHDLYAHLLKYIFLYFILVNFFDSTRKLFLLSWIIICSSTGLFVWSLYYFYVTLGNPLTTRFGACYTEVPTNVIGIIAGISIILGIYNTFQAKGWVRKVFFSSCLLPAFAVIFLTQTRGALLALFLALVVLLSERKKMLVGIMLLAGGVLLVSPAANRFTINETENVRSKQALLVWEVVKDYPITGIGFGMQTFGKNLDLHNYNAKLPEKLQKQEILLDPHNMYTDITVRTGIPGIVLFFGVIFSFFRMLWQLKRHGENESIAPWATAVLASGIPFFIIGFFDPVFSHYPESIQCVIFAMGTILWRINEDSKLSVTA